MVAVGFEWPLQSSSNRCCNVSIFNSAHLNNFVLYYGGNIEMDFAADLSSAGRTKLPHGRNYSLGPVDPRQNTHLRCGINCRCMSRWSLIKKWRFGVPQSFSLSRNKWGLVHLTDEEKSKLNCTRFIRWTFRSDQIPFLTFWSSNIIPTGMLKVSGLPSSSFLAELARPETIPSAGERAVDDYSKLIYPLCKRAAKLSA